MPTDTATKLFTRRQLKPGKFYMPVGPKGEELQGTLERLSGCAGVNSIHLEGNAIEIDWDGDTKMFWDEQRTEEDRGKRVWLTREGQEFRESQLLFQEETP